MPCPVLELTEMEDNVVDRLDARDRILTELEYQAMELMSQALGWSPGTFRWRLLVDVFSSRVDVIVDTPEGPRVAGYFLTDPDDPTTCGLWVAADTPTMSARTA
jgi:hypothetical protein